MATLVKRRKMPAWQHDQGGDSDKEDDENRVIQTAPVTYNLPGSPEFFNDVGSDNSDKNRCQVDADVPRPPDRKSRVSISKAMFMTRFPSDISSSTGRKAVAKSGGMFADAGGMKDQVKRAIQKPEYNVMNFYHETGICQAMARSKAWDYATLMVIACNTLWIAVDAEFNDADLLMEAPIMFQVAEHLFCFAFFFEWIVRFSAFKDKKDCFRDTSFVFDTVLAWMSVGETWIMTCIVAFYFSGGAPQIGNTSVLRLFRLIRISRMARVLRLLRALPELMVLIKGVVSAGRSVFFTLCLLVVVLFIFAVAFKQLSKDTDFGEKYFQSIFGSMFSLLVYGTVPDMSEIILAASAEHFLFCAMLLAYIFVAFFTVLNLLIGVIVQVVDVVSQVENEEITVKDVRRRLLSALSKLFPDSRGEATRISKDDFQLLLTTADSARAINDLGVDVVGLLESEDFIFQDNNVGLGYTTDSITFGAFMEAVLQLRGTNQATVKNIVDLRKFIIHSLTMHQKDLMDQLSSCLLDVVNKSANCGGGGNFEDDEA